VTGVVLAGGRSARFGRDKLREPYRGAPLVHHAILALSAVCGEVLVVAPPGKRPDLPGGVPLLLQHDVAEGEGPLAAVSNALANVRTPLALVVAPPGERPDLPGGVPLLLQHDVAEGEGPLAAVSNALANVRTPLALVVGGDMPELAGPVLLEMLRVAEEADVDAIALREGERFRPLPVVLRLGRARPVAAGLVRSGERRLRTLLDALRVAVVDEPTWRNLDPAGRTLFDVDEPDDLSG
jgi:molybdopterin-guanine dinucleotide biosynthesis protein A